MRKIFIDLWGKEPQVIDGDIAQAEKLADYMFNDAQAAKILEDYGPTGYTGRVYLISQDAQGHRREVLFFRVSTVGPKPQFKGGNP